MIDSEKVIKALADRIRDCSGTADGFDVTINWKLADDILALLKEQEVELCDRCGRMRLKSKRIVEGR